VTLDLGQLLTFLIASFVVTAVPGQDVALIIRQVLAGGVGLGQCTVAGSLTGILLHGFGLAAGLSTLLLASATAYTAVKIAGACYLAYLGVQALRSARHPKAPSVPESPSPPGRAVPTHRAAYLQGVISTVLNPKPALFFLTFLPQFINPQRAVLPQALTMALLHVAMGLVVLTTYANLVHRAHRVLTRAAVTRWLERITGIVLIGLGVRVALERR
jgi:threonine/homoserine/homoserine lactone efflux protein